MVEFADLDGLITTSLGLLLLCKLSWVDVRVAEVRVPLQVVIRVVSNLISCSYKSPIELIHLFNAILFDLTKNGWRRLPGANRLVTRGFALASTTTARRHREVRVLF